jgi:hypothetical protein
MSKRLPDARLGNTSLCKISQKLFFRIFFTVPEIIVEL